jgi:hypothetical protein
MCVVTGIVYEPVSRVCMILARFSTRGSAIPVRETGDRAAFAAG